MRENITLINGSSHKCLDQFKTQFSNADIYKVTCFFDGENFILSDYCFDITGINMVVECEDQSLIYITSLNCGYQGEGPSCTDELLQFIGVDHAYAKYLSQKRGFCIKKVKSNWEEQHVVILFAQRAYESALGICKLDNSFNDVNVTNRSVIMIQPQQHDLGGLINCIKSMGITEIEFNLGKKEPMYTDIITEDLTSEFQKNYNSHKFNGINLVLHGTVFSIFCFISCDELITLVNVLHTYIMKKPLYIGGVYGDFIMLAKNEKWITRANILKSLLCGNKKTPKIIYRIQVGEENVLLNTEKQYQD